MVHRWSLIRGWSLALLGAVVGAVPAWATIDNVKTYKAAYPGKDAKAYSCKTCHDNAVGKADDLNTYGKALQQFKADQGAKQLTVEDYQAFDTADQDADGTTNAQELEAGTDPLDPASCPSAAAPADAVPAEPAASSGTY